MRKINNNIFINEKYLSFILRLAKETETRSGKHYNHNKMINVIATCTRTFNRGILWPSFICTRGEFFGYLSKEQIAKLTVQVFQKEISEYGINEGLWCESFDIGFSHDFRRKYGDELCKKMFGYYDKEN